MESVLRMRVASSYTSIPSHVNDDDAEDVAVDFSNAVLYIGALQTIAATVLTAFVGIVSCVAIPGNLVSAVRTLVLSSLVGVSVVRRPFRLGRVHGLSLIFRALQPCVLIYIGAEVAEQLVHTCTRDSSAPSWRRLVFHSMSAVMLISGFMRARRPLAQTDLPFLLTMLALFVVAMLPPPAIILSGPLCSAPTFNTAAERVVRAFTFSLLYCVFVYAAAPPVQSSAEVIICVMRASAASIWVLGSHSLLLPLAVVQGSVVIYTRIFGAEYALEDEQSPLMSSSSLAGGRRYPHAFDLENAGDDGADDCAHDGGNATTPTTAGGSSTLAGGALASGTGAIISPPFQALGARGLVDIGGGAIHALGSGTGACGGSGVCAHRASGFGDVNVAAIAARLEAEDSHPPHGPGSGLADPAS
jgi:hypothetical protein